MWFRFVATGATLAVAAYAAKKSKDKLVKSQSPVVGQIRQRAILDGTPSLASSTEILTDARHETSRKTSAMSLRQKAAAGLMALGAVGALGVEAKFALGGGNKIVAGAVGGAVSGHMAGTAIKQSASTLTKATIAGGAASGAAVGGACVNLARDKTATGQYKWGPASCGRK